MRIGVDTGGTFTDVVAVDAAGGLRVLKIPSTPEDPSRAVLDGVAGVVGGAPAGGVVGEVVHGTTVATNALLERTGGPTVLVATRGFEDLLELRRQARPRLYALHPEVPAPLVEAGRRLGLAERLGPDGTVVEALEEAALAALVERVAAEAGRPGGEAIRSVAVALLHAYADPRHERLAGERLRALGLPVSLSSEVLPEHREYERTSTTVVDAYVAPVLAGYLGRLAAALGEAGGPRLRIMQSSGTAALAGEVRRRPVGTILSGPAAGVVGARAVARRLGLPRIITFDMGGTSTDVALLDASMGEPELTTESEIAGQPVAIPSLRVHTVGAGGGSLAWVDPGGALKVGPRSAGARPGPACYGRGGSEPAVTDAALVEGRLDPERFLGGGMRLDEPAAERAVAALAARLELAPRAAAAGVARVATAVMARAIRVISVERGHDPRDFALVAFGGAGGMYACDVAAEVGVERVLVPAAPGLLCAYGALAADVGRDHAATRLVPVDAALDARALAAELAPLEARAHADLDAEGVPAGARRIERRVDLRYLGQSYELSLPVPSGGDGREALLPGFHALHHLRYGFSDPGRPVERVALRVHARGLTPPPPPLAVVPEAGEPRVGRRGEATVYQRGRLRPGARLDGPAIIVEYSGTTWVPTGWRVEVGADGVLDLRRV